MTANDRHFYFSGHRSSVKRGISSLACKFVFIDLISFIRIKDHDICCLSRSDIALVNGGVMNEDEHARELGLKGITNSVEDIIVARDIMLSHDTGAKLHLCHCSTEDSVMMVDLAKQKNVKVTAEVCPHHFTLTSDDIRKIAPEMDVEKNVIAADSVAKLKRKLFWYVYPDIDYKWVCWSKVDGGWCDYDIVTKNRQNRKKVKRENVDGEE